MDKKSKILLTAVIILILISVSATFYQSVIQQNIELTGVGVEVGDDYIYTWFIYNQEEYEFEVASTSFQELLNEIEYEIGSIDPNFLTELEVAYLENLE